MKIYPGIFIATGVQLIGEVSIGENSSVWYNSVLRGDINTISVGKGTNIQDLCCIHVGDDHPVSVGDDCVIGHNVNLHGAKVGNRVLVGIGAIILNGVEIGDDCIIGAGALVLEGSIIPANSVVLGSPAKIIRSVTAEEKNNTLNLARKYQGVAQKSIRSTIEGS